MDADRWRQISALYHEARGRNEEERRAFLDAACGDNAVLRQELDALLADDTRAEAFLAVRVGAVMEGLAGSGATRGSPVLHPGDILGTYRIERLLGQGGMGAVFLGYDTKLHRQVALKVIDTGGDTTVSARLLLEARNAAALNHPHICTIYEVGQAGGTAFIAMEYVAGRSLRDRLDAGTLPLVDVLALSAQAADALACAHAHGVTHRDFKAANAIVTDEGRLKIVDFGLARRADATMTDATTMASLVPAGTAAGTPYAMAPEQVRGEKADARTDIWGLGVLLYEMVGGGPPFRAATPADLFSAILRDQVRPLPRHIPRDVRRVIERCLEKRPDARYQHATEVRVALEHIQTASESPAMRAGARPRRLAVLPLANMSRDADQDYFVDGTHEALITDLACISGLRVIARTSVVRYRNRDVPLQEIAADLGVDAVLMGAVMRAGDRVRLTAQLVDVATDELLWGARYERELRDILALQNEIVGEIAAAIHLHLTQQEEIQLAAPRVVQPDAYDAYLRGRFHWYKLSGAHLDAALGYFQSALRKDPQCALAYAGVALTWLSRGDIGIVPAPEALAPLRAALARALALDASRPEVHEIDGNAKFLYEWDWAGAEVAFLRAIDLNPNYADAHFFYSDFLISMHQVEEARDEMARARELDPLNTFYRCFDAWHLVYLGRHEEAIRTLQQLLDLEPASSSVHLGLWGAYYRARHLDAAAEAATAFFRVIDDEEVAAVMVRTRAAGYPQMMRAAAETLAARRSRAHVPSVRVARLFAHADQAGLALDWLERAYEDRETPLVHLAIGWDWHGVKREARFQALLDRMRFPGGRPRSAPVAEQND